MTWGYFTTILSFARGVVNQYELREIMRRMSLKTDCMGLVYRLDTTRQTAILGRIHLTLLNLELREIEDPTRPSSACGYEL